MATMDSIKSELIADGQAALANMDPVLLEKVVQDMLAYNKIQGEIDALKTTVDALSPPAVPVIKVIS